MAKLDTWASWAPKHIARDARLFRFMALCWFRQAEDRAAPAYERRRPATDEELDAAIGPAQW